MLTTIEIYTQPFCPYCTRAMALLTSKGAAFREIAAPGGSAARAQAATRSGGRTSVPQIFINGAHIGGSDDLAALDRAGKLDALVAA
jgi:glutaredoxin 3